MLEIGSKYENGYGVKVNIVSGPCDGSYYFEDEVGIQYERNGDMYSPAGKDFRFNLRLPR